VLDVAGQRMLLATSNFTLPYMSQSDEVLLKRWYEEVWNAGRESTITELMAPDMKMHGMGPEPLVGPEGFLPFFRDFRSKFEDIHIDVTQTVRQENMEVANCHVTATHKESGKKVDFTGICMGRLENGQFVEGWNQFDFGTMLQQLSS